MYFYLNTIVEILSMTVGCIVEENASVLLCAFVELRILVMRLYVTLTLLPSVMRYAVPNFIEASR
jgi:hypothetical protein